MPTQELMIAVGEASGDLHAAALVEALRRRQPELRLFGCGGPKLAAAGCEILVPARELAVVGLFEVARHLPRIHGHFRRMVRALRQRRPAGLILVDFPDFNLRLAAAARKAGIPVAYFISPQVWAWREGRVGAIRRDVRRMICIFPFEQAFYARHGIEVAAVGHPLVDRVAALRATLPPEAAFRKTHGLDSQAPIVALLPGSRRREVAFHLPTMLVAAQRLRAERDVQFVVPVAEGLSAAAVRESIPPPQRPWVHVVSDATYEALAHARVAVVASGTATVETALLGTPMVVVYRLSRWTYGLGRRWVKTPHFAMVNLVAEREVVPELIQNGFQPEAIVNWVSTLLEDSPERRHQIAALAEVSARLGPPGAIERAATAVEQALCGA